MNLRREKPREGRPAEWTPEKNAVVLGRVLHLWTGLKGDKSEHATRFPRYLRYAPKWVARDFLRVYVQRRGIERDDTNRRLQISEKRTDEYRRQLVGQLERVVSNPDDIRGDTYPIYIVGVAIAELTGRRSRSRI